MLLELPTFIVTDFEPLTTFSLVSATSCALTVIVALPSPLAVIVTFLLPDSTHSLELLTETTLELEELIENCPPQFLAVIVIEVVFPFVKLVDAALTLNDPVAAFTQL